MIGKGGGTVDVNGKDVKVSFSAMLNASGKLCS
jgi:hypothetical protein